MSIKGLGVVAIVVIWLLGLLVSVHADAETVANDISSDVQTGADAVASGIGVAADAVANTTSDAAEAVASGATNVANDGAGKSSAAIHTMAGVLACILFSWIN